MIGPVGVWQNVTPAGLNLVPTAFGGDNFGCQDIIVDPVRPSDIYLFVCHQGVWKSTNYGQTFNKVNLGTGGAELDLGKPWGAAIDTNPSRDPNTAPTIWTCCGNDVAGLWRSTDGAVSWVRKTLPDQAGRVGQYRDQDIYAIDCDPYDGQHLIISFHENPGLVETVDGGDNFIVRASPDNGVSQYPYFIDTGNPTTTRTTWLIVPQEAGNTYRTTNSSTSWTQVGTFQHPHGCNQIFQAGGGVVYLPSYGGPNGSGIYRSADYAATWTQVSTVDVNNVIGTTKNLYASYSWADNTGAEAQPQTALRSNGTSWSMMSKPAFMTNGAKRSCVTRHPSGREIMLWSCWNAGVMRWVEP